MAWVKSAQMSSRGVRRVRGTVGRATGARGSVLVLGGTGFVGRHVVSELTKHNTETAVASRMEPSSEEPLPAGVKHVKVDFLEDDDRVIESIMEGFDTVVSLVGAIGGSDPVCVNANGATNQRAVDAAKQAGVERFVYVSVDPLVKNTGFQNFGLFGLKGYLDGKEQAEQAVNAAFPEEESTILCPSFVYGGDSFNLSPPRVPDDYGRRVEALLSEQQFTSITEKLPAPLKLVAAPPVSVSNLAKAVTACALKKSTSHIVVGTSEINETAKLL